jgi:hypothetical protein
MSPLWMLLWLHHGNITGQDTGQYCVSPFDFASQGRKQIIGSELQLLI